ncbi:IclR family transcriptional regulator [Actinobacteria bacterium YIM 96077]|uniref:Glycerol operon regulatory protein n=1 Tax=Phytoactinopolyspora halophila TaxID=1981511 RepID=A0A329QKY6_9ACTN|nr:IclR family transcriptional regulator C-terminal domain-containing protein [Phytoactinopolyspora halophila]AYY13624.1 IclR family transcriptional regulator [Actinobacteria bacterium YIM 96077]RAW11188.1 IclR family transcriptional regulator [Phytoactinopolyspora halophila]
MKRNGDRPSDQVRSVSRALRLLEEVGASPSALPVKAIARRTGLNLSTTYHLVRTLAYDGYLERQPDGRYSLGASIAHRFHDLLGSLRRRPDRHAVLSHLSATTGRSAYLGRLISGEVVIMDLVEGPQSPYLEDLEVGLSTSAHATAVGKALLKALSRDTRRHYLAENGMRPYTSRTVTNPDELEYELACTTSSQPIKEHGQFRDGVACVAALVHTEESGDQPWAVVVSNRGEAMPDDVTRHTMLAAADLSQTIS